MEYYVPNGSHSQARSLEPVPVNPSTVPGGRPFPFPDQNGKHRRMPPPAMPETVAPPAPPSPAGSESMPRIPAPPNAAAVPESRPRPYLPNPLPPEESHMPNIIYSAPADVFDMPVMTPNVPERALGMPSPRGGCPSCPGGIAEAMPLFDQEFLFSPMFTPGFLRGQVGRIMRVESLTGSALTERIGRLIHVGVNFLVLQSAEGHTIVCDLESVRFATILPSQEYLL